MLLIVKVHPPTWRLDLVGWLPEGMDGIGIEDSRFRIVAVDVAVADKK